MTAIDLTAGDLAEAALYAGAGVALGTVYFLLLARTARLHASQAAAGVVIPLYFARLGAAVAGFWLIAQQGALPLISALVGFLAARFLVQRRMGAE